MMHNVIEREKLEQVLEALKLSSVIVDSFGLQKKMQEAHAICKQALAAQPAVPEGWKLVPIKPTMQMINALADTDPEHESVWDAVLAAAPEKGQP
jgi:hypothetical protein